MKAVLESFAMRLTESLRKLDAQNQRLSEPQLRHLFVSALSPAPAATDLRFEYPHPSLPG